MSKQESDQDRIGITEAIGMMQLAGYYSYSDHINRRGPQKMFERGQKLYTSYAEIIGALCELRPDLVAQITNPSPRINDLIEPLCDLTHTPKRVRDYSQGIFSTVGHGLSRLGALANGCNYELIKQAASTSKNHYDLAVNYAELLAVSRGVRPEQVLSALLNRDLYTRTLCENSHEELLWIMSENAPRLWERITKLTNTDKRHLNISDTQIPAMWWREDLGVFQLPSGVHVYLHTAMSHLVRHHEPRTHFADTDFGDSQFQKQLMFTERYNRHLALCVDHIRANTKNQFALLTL